MVSVSLLLCPKKKAKNDDVKEQHDKLKDKYIKAENALKALPEDADDKKRKSAEAKLKSAEDALEKFSIENNLVIPEEQKDQKDLNEIEVVLNDDDFANTPELKEEFKVGETVIVDKKELEENGITKVLRRKE